MIDQDVYLLTSASGIIILLQFIAVAGFAVYFLLDVLRGTRKLQLVDWSVMIVLVIAAFLLRWLLPFHTFVHENHHSFAYTIEREWLWISPHGIPSAHHALANWFFKVSPTPAESTFLMNALIASVAVAGIYAWAKQIFCSRIAGWSSAVFLTTLPVAIAFAPTEECLVTATGLGFCGFALLGHGTKNNDRSALISGTLLVCLAASVRDIALPISACIPIAVIVGSSREQGIQWRALILTTTLATFTLLPRAVLIIILALNPENDTAFLSFPPDLFGYTWVGWYAPMVPTWLVLAFFAGLLALVIHLAYAREWRPLAGALCFFLVAQSAAGLVAGGNFPSHLRHQQFAIALITLAPGFLVAFVFSKCHEKIKWTGFLVAPLLGILTLSTTPESYLLQYPAMEEFRFFINATEKREVKGSVLLLDAQGRNFNHVDRYFAFHHQPDWRLIESSEWRAPNYSLPDGHVYLFLDRACFHSETYFPARHQEQLREAMNSAEVMVRAIKLLASAVRSAWVGIDTPMTPSSKQEGAPVIRDELNKLQWPHPTLVPADMVPSPYGPLRKHCAEPLNRWTWLVLDSKTVGSSPASMNRVPFHVTMPDLVSVRGKAPIAILEIAPDPAR